MNGDEVILGQNERGRSERDKLNVGRNERRRSDRAPIYNETIIVPLYFV
jgi:hypothetical protein